MKLLYFFSIMLLPSIVKAQPDIIDASSIIPPGNTYNAKYATISDLGPIGPAATWDFSTESFSTLTTLAIVEPSLTTFALDFPTATWAYEVGSWTAYFEATSVGFYNLAFNITSTGGTGDYSADSRKILKFPFVYNESYTDTYSESGNSKNLNVTYEGFGTLIMPDGYTYDEVVRIREEEDNGDVFTRYYTLTPFMNIGIHFSYNSFFTWIQTPSSISAIEENAAESFFVYPNPVNDKLEIRSAINGSKQFSIYNSVGCLIQQSDWLFDSKYTLDVSKLQSGTYLVSDGETIKRFTKQ